MEEVVIPPISPYGVVFLLLRILLYICMYLLQHTCSCCLWRWWTQVAASQCRWSPRPNGETPVGECPGRRNGDGGTKLRLDGGGICPSAWGRWRWWRQRRASTPQRRWIKIMLFSNRPFHVCSYFLFSIRPLFS
jgi:hypothetical protein